MSKSGSTNIQSIGQKDKKTSSNSNRAVDVKFVDYIALDTFRRETVLKEEEAKQTWKAKYDPWLIDEHRKMYENISKSHGIPPNNHVIPLKRSEWQQPVDTLPPIHKRLPGQRRRRVLGGFPETENDKIGWRILPSHAIDIYGSKLANIAPLPRQYKFSSWPVESFS